MIIIKPGAGGAAVNIGILDFEQILQPVDFSILQQKEQKLSIIKDLQQIDEIQGLIIYGQDSTFLESMLNNKKTIKLPIFGLGNALLMMAQKVEGEDELNLGLLNITVKSKNNSIEEVKGRVLIPILGREPISVIYKNTPEIIDVGPNVGILSTQERAPVMVRQGDYLGASFHPEITEDVRIFDYFYEMVKDCYF